MTHQALLRALAEEIDATLPIAREALLRGAGARLARAVPVAPAGSLPALEIEINDTLAGIGFGQTRLALDAPARLLRIVHTGLPRLGSLGTPPGAWLSAVLEGLYTAWMAQQPGWVPPLAARLTRAEANAVCLDFGRVTASVAAE